MYSVYVLHNSDLSSDLSLFIRSNFAIHRTNRRIILITTDTHAACILLTAAINVNQTRVGDRGHGKNHDLQRSASESTYNVNAAPVLRMYN